jgi:hypothetical protein
VLEGSDHLGRSQACIVYRMQTREAVGASPAARDRSILRASASERHAAWHVW